MQSVRERIAERFLAAGSPKESVHVFSFREELNHDDPIDAKDVG